MSISDFISPVPLFQKLTFADRNRLATSIRFRHLQKGEILFRKGNEGSSLYIIRTGTIKVSLPSPQGEEVVLAIFSAGDFFGEMALLDGMPRSADATAIEPTELLLLNRQDFLAFLLNNKDAMQAVLESLSHRLRRTDVLLEDTCFLPISARFAKKLVELAVIHGCEDEQGVHIELSLTQRDLANMVGATRESINKELRVLREKGIVTIRDNTICIYNLERLKRRAH